MNKIVIILICLMLCGCGETLRDITRTMKINEKQQAASTAVSKGDVSIKYPAMAPINITVSGNGILHYNAGEPLGMVEATKHQDKKASDKSQSSFSLDETFESVSIMGWLFMALAFAIFVGSYIAFTKFTAAGRETDKLVAGGLKATRRGIGRASKVLEDSEPNSDAYNIARKERDELQVEEGKLLKQENRKRSFFKWET